MNEWGIKTFQWIAIGERPKRIAEAIMSKEEVDMLDMRGIAYMLGYADRYGLTYEEAIYAIQHFDYTQTFKDIEKYQRMIHQRIDYEELEEIEKEIEAFMDLAISLIMKAKARKTKILTEAMLVINKLEGRY